MTQRSSHDESGEAAAGHKSAGPPLVKPRQPWWVWMAPLCFALFPVISLYAANIGEVHWSSVLRPGKLILGMTLILSLALFALLRNAPKAAVTLSAALFLFFSYRFLPSLMPSITELLIFFLPTAAGTIDQNLILFPLWSAIFLAAMVFCFRARRDFTPAASLLVVVGTVLLAMPLLTIIQRGTGFQGDTFSEINRPSETPGAADRNSAVPVAGPGKSSAAAAVPAIPDIYYIILDAYGRQDTLKEFYGYDNEPFLRELEKRGFYIARRSRANYCQTVLCLASSLNMDYLDALARKAGKTSSDLTRAGERIDKNAVAALLRTRGYQYVFITTGTPLTFAASADLILGSKPRKQRFSVFEGLLVDTTPLTVIPRVEDSLYDEHRDYLLSAFEHLSQVPRLRSPKFVFAHILAPHPPFVLGAHGEPLTPKRPFNLVDGSGFLWRSTQEEYKRGYINQLRYVNTRVLRAIDDIYARSARRPIIIVQGDHGSRMTLDWKEIHKTNLREPFANLNAYSVPNGDASQFLYQDISPVNSFRLVLNHYFGTSYKRLPDRSYYSPLAYPYHFTDVTDRTTQTQPTP